MMQATLTLSGKHVQIQSGDQISNELATIFFHCSESNGQGKQLQILISPKTEVNLQQVSIDFEYDYTPAQSIFCNGFQSWSESREYASAERIPTLKWFARSLMKYYGDAHFQEIPREKGYFHSWTYSYVRLQTGRLFFIGSLNEAIGFTWFGHDLKRGVMSIHKDCIGLKVRQPFIVLDVLIIEGTEAAVFEAWFSALKLPAPTAPRATGWTSWYNYYTNISEATLLKNLATQALIPVEQQAALHFFQIDDGYQTRVGDWLNLKPSFPNGMAVIANQIHHAGSKAGIWIAPFICEQKSTLFQEHPDWLLRDDFGAPVRAGWNPLWSGWFYALDFYNEAFREAYLRPVLEKMLLEWKFDLLKLDFLYAVCILPRPDKSRGMIMREAMQWLREVAGEKWLLGCGVPLGSAFGLVDYCRIGADIHLSWEHRLLRFLGNRERVSTLLALRTTLGRWRLDGKVWRNDPDVFLLRRHNIRLSEVQQRTILLVNALCGGLLFTSDELNLYAPAQWETATLGFELLSAQMQSVEHRGADLYFFTFLHNGQIRYALCNLNVRAKSISAAGQVIHLQPFEFQFLAP